MKLNKREKTLVLTIAALLLLFGIKAFIFDPLREKMSAVSQDIERSQLAIRKFIELSRQRDIILKAQKKIERYLKLKGSNEEKLGAILSAIEAEARKSGLLILDMNPVSTSMIKSAPQVFRVQLRAEADMVKILDFLYSLESSDILFKIEKLELSAKEGNPKLLKIETSILGIAIS